MSLANASARHMFSQLWCPSSSTQDPETSLFVYAGADVDVTLLRLLQNNERSVAFVDPLDTMPEEVVHPWNKHYGASATSQSIRPFNHSDSSKHQLQALLTDRLRAEKHIRNVTWTTPLSFKFYLYELSRAFQYHVVDAEVFLGTGLARRQIHSITFAQQQCQSVARSTVRGRVRARKAHI